MKTLSSKLKINKFSPLQIGFIASFILHSALFASLLDFKRLTRENSMQSKSLNIAIANIAGQNLDSQQAKKSPQKNYKKHKKHKHKHKKHKVLQKEMPFAPSQTPPQEQKIQEIAESSEDSAVDSSAGASVNQGEIIEILGSGDALHASILDIINKNRGNYPKMARMQGLQDKIRVEFILLTSGDVREIRIISGRHRILNNDAISVIKRSAGQLPKPERNKRVSVVLAYDLVK
ncbi:TonB family protein [Helicobacter sp. 23-1044]